MPDILTLAEDLISKFETKDAKSGWNEEEQRWFPYKSLEGGAPTLGYGEKLFKDRYPEEEIEAFFSEGISDPYAKLLRRKRIVEGLDTLEGFIGKPLDSFMSKHQQAAAASFIYNAGVGKDWKFTENLRRAAETEDLSERSVFIEEAGKEMDIVTATIKGKKVVLKGLVKRRSAEQELFRRLARPE